ncbi:MAG: hypothetical protein AVDCRST_MAG54-27, partial [uncultured Actinomycetospora sp.]
AEPTPRRPHLGPGRRAARRGRRAERLRVPRRRARARVAHEPEPVLDQRLPAPRAGAAARRHHARPGRAGRPVRGAASR